MTYTRSLRWTAALWLAMTGMAVAQSFSEQVTGIYRTASDFDFALQLTLWPEGDGFAGDALIAAASYPVYAEQDGPALRGVFDVDGTLQRFTFLPSKSGQIAVQFSGEPAPILMARAALPSFTGRYSGEFGAVTVRASDGQLMAEFLDPSGTSLTGKGVAQGLRVAFPDLPASIYFEPTQEAYFLDLPGFFGPASRGDVPLRVGQNDNADFATLAEALSAAPADAKIELMPGTYKGPVTANVAVHIIGSGKVGDVVLTADTGTLLKWAANGGSLSNVTLQVPKSGTGISQESGTLSVLNTTIQSDSGGIGVRATGSGALKLQNAKITGGDHALQVQSFDGGLTVVSSSLSATTKSIMSVNGTTPETTIEITDSELFNTPSNALQFHDVGTVTVEATRISDVRVGMHHTGGGATHVWETSLAGASAHGFWLEGLHRDSLRFTNNVVDGVGQACVLFNNVNFPANWTVLKNNRMKNCGRIAVAVAGEETMSNGVGIKLLDEEFEQSGTHLAVYAPVPVEVEKTRFNTSSGPGVVLGDGASLSAKETSMVQTGEVGIVAVGNDISVILDNTRVSASGKSGIVLSGGVTAEMKGAAVSENQGHGIELYHGTKVNRFADNSITDNQGAGIFVSGVVFSPESGNDIHGNTEGDIKRQ